MELLKLELTSIEGVKTEIRLNYNDDGVLFAIVNHELSNLPFVEVISYEKSKDFRRKLNSFNFNFN